MQWLKSSLLIVVCSLSANAAFGADSERDLGTVLKVLTAPCKLPPPTTGFGCIADVNPDIVKDMRTATRAVIPLSDDKVIRARRLALQRNETGFTWFGTLVGQAGDMILTAEGDTFLATVHMDSTILELRPIGEQTFEIMAVRPVPFVGDEPTHVVDIGDVETYNLIEPFVPEVWHPLDFERIRLGRYPIGRIPVWRIPPITSIPFTPPPSHLDQNTLLVDDGSVIDVLPLITFDAVAWTQSLAVARAYAQHGIDQTNIALNESGIHTWLNMLPPRFVVHTPTNNGDPEIAIEQLRVPDDGVLDELHDWRNEDAADLVILVGGPDDYPVHGAAMSRPFNNESVAEAAGFGAVFNIDFNGMHFAHEIGHLLALAHDWFVQDSGAGIGFDPADFLPDAHGHTTPVVGVNDLPRMYFSLMAYGSECNATISNPRDDQCVWKMRYSNPNYHLMFIPENLAVPFGVPQPLEEAADAVGVANSQIQRIARYRQSACRSFPSYQTCPQ